MKKLGWIGLLLVVVAVSATIAYYISQQSDLMGEGASKTPAVKEDAIEVVSGDPGASSAAASGSSGEDGEKTGAGDRGAGGEGEDESLSDEERAKRALELARVADGAEGSAATGKVDRADIMEAITRVKPLVKQCYEVLLEDFPEASGKIVVQMKVLSIEGIGEVEAIKVGEENTTLFDTKMHECMKSSLGLVTFPMEGEEDGEVVVNYPFTFTTAAE